MTDSWTIVFEDQQLLRIICGVHDENLKILETALGSKVFVRGNEIILDSEDEEKQHVFSEIIDQIKGYEKRGRHPDPELVETVCDMLLHGGKNEHDLLKELNIHIPSSLKVFPRTYNQAAYIEAMDKNDIVFGIGPAGTGKTYLAVAHALKEILEKKKKKLVLTRPVVEAGESLGFLPGDLTQKISPYLRPLYDAIDALVPYHVLTRLEESRIIEIAPLAYMRGRSLKDSYIILDEAQNTTREQMKMFLTRLGEGSKAIITGDITQIDLPVKEKSGLLQSIDILRPISEICFIFFTSVDVVRNPLVKKIVNAYEREEKQ